MSDERQKTSIDIVAEMRRGMDKSWHEIDREWARDLPDRLEAALKREKASIEADALAVGGMVEAARHNPGNTAAMREALEHIKKLAREFSVGNYYISEFPKMLLDVIRPALVAPPRNCDVGTIEEQTNRFRDYCCGKCDGSKCKHAIYMEDTIYKCAIEWTQMPYELGT